MRRHRLLLAALPLSLGLWLAATLLAKDIIPTPPDTPVLGEVEPWLIETVGAAADPEAKLGDFVEDAEFKRLVSQHGLELFGGPMLGSLTESSVRIWVRTAAETEVAAVVYDAESGEEVKRSASKKTAVGDDLVGLLDIEGLASQTLYQYDVLLEGEPVFGAGERPTFRTYPAPGEAARFSVGFGGGARVNPPKEGIWDTIAARKPAAFLFLGDNLYIDLPKERNTQRLYYYRRQLRPEFRRLAARTGIYAVWDDHDFGANDDEGGPERFVPEWKLPVWKVFRENWVNPAYGGGEELPGCWFDFSIGEVDVFMTDGRYYRSFKGRSGPERTMLGPDQKAWLLERLAASKATFKIIASGTLWTKHADKGGRDSWWGAKEERQEIFDLIRENGIGGVILISADRHRSDIYEIEWGGDYPIYEFESSKLTNNHTHKTREQALFSYNEGNFFGLLDFDFTVDDPTVTFECVTAEGEVVKQFPLRRSQLGPPTPR